MGQTLGNIYNNVSFALNLHAAAMSRLQEQASSGSRVNRVSDDPSDGYQILGFNSQERSLANYIDNLSEALATLQFSSTILTKIGSAIAETTTRLTQIINGIYGEGGQKRLADGINDILEHVVSLANTKHNNQCLFGGSNTDTAPYAVTRTDGEITAVAYQGGAEKRAVEFAPGVQVPVFYVGDDIFRSDSRSTPVFSGDTGAQAGTGTPSVRGDVWLTVIHDGSNYKLSIDDGATYVTVLGGGDPNQPVTDSRTDRVLYVDSTAINKTGVEMIRVPGTYNVFDALINIRDILKNERALPTAQVLELIGESLNSLGELRNLLVQSQVTMGSKIGFLSDVKDGLKERKYNAEDEANRLQQADIAQVAIDLSRRELLYQMSLSVAAKVMSMSLLDFLR